MCIRKCHFVIQDKTDVPPALIDAAERLRSILGGVKTLVKSLARNLVISFRIKTGNRRGQKQLFLNSLVHPGLFAVPQENDYLPDHSFQSLIVTLVIRIAAPRSHLDFRFARSRRMAVIILWLPRCTLAVSQPIA